MKSCVNLLGNSIVPMKPQVFSNYDKKSKTKIVKLDNRRSSLENLEAKIKAEQELMEKNRELEKSLESQYNAGTRLYH